MTDPNEVLAEIRKLVADVNNDVFVRPQQFRDTLYDLAEYVDRLDEHMSKGCYAPSAWMYKRPGFGLLQPPKCLNCGKNEARYLSGQCGVCDSLLVFPTKLLRDATPEEAGNVLAYFLPVLKGQ